MDFNLDKIDLVLLLLYHDEVKENWKDTVYLKPDEEIHNIRYKNFLINNYNLVKEIYKRIGIEIIF